MARDIKARTKATANATPRRAGRPRAGNGGEQLRQAEVAQEDPDLAQVVATSRPSIDRVQDAVFDAQGRIMVEVSRLLGQPDWVSIEAEEGEALELETAHH